MAQVKKDEYLQHGDVILRRAGEIPAGAQRTTRSVVATGEVTGHAHRLLEDADVEVYEDAQGTLWLRVGPAGAGITHEEHGLGVIPPGVWRDDRVREYDHFLEESRRVRD